MIYTQKLGKYKTKISLHDSEVEYLLSVDGINEGATVPYHHLGKQWIYNCKKRTHFYFFAAYIHVLIGLLVMHFGLQHGWQDSGIIFLFFLGVACLFLLIGVFLDKNVMITSLPGDPPLRILHDEQYHRILSEIKRRSHEQIRAKNKDIDFSSTPEAESKKFFWARYNGLISETEFTSAMAKLSAMKQGGQMQSFESSKTPNN